MTDHLPDSEQILRTRARALAQPRESLIREETITLLEFRLAQERYAVETRYVHEVHPLRELTSLPGTPPFLRGIVNLRGRIVAVLDLKRFFDLPETGFTDLHRVVVVRGNDMEVGLLADVVAGVHELPVKRMQPSLPTLTGIRAQYLMGVTDERLVVLDVARVLADPRIVVHDDNGS